MEDKIKKIYVIDTVITGANHIVVNSGVLQILQLVNQGDTEVTFWAADSHIEQICKTLHPSQEANFIFKPIEVIVPKANPLAKAVTWWTKLRNDKAVINSILDEAVDNKIDLVVFSTIISINLLRFQSRLSELSNRLRVAVILHGEIESLFVSNISTSQKMEARFYRKAFAASPPNLKYIVLNKLIRDKMIKAGLVSAHQLLYMEHPIQDITRPHNMHPFQQLRLSFIGVANRRKGGDMIFELARYFKEQVQNKELEFRIIGRLDADIIEPEDDLVTILAKDGRPIEQKLYGQFIQESAFSLSFITGQEYVFRISGSIMDSIQYQIPLIALKHTYIEFIFKEAGDVGYLCEDLEEMQKVISDVLQNRGYIADRYPQQVQNLKNYSNRFKTKHITEILVRNMQEAGWSFA